MSPNEEAVFAEALEMADPKARAEFLDRACAGDATLRAGVESLLAAYNAGSFLEVPALKLEQKSQADPVGDTEAELADRDDGAVSLSFLSASDKPGSLGRLGHYEVQEIIGQGGMGIVLRAFDEKLHRIVAIKVMSSELAATSPPRKRFLREARSAAQVRHEHVVDIHAVEDLPIPYLVMEYVSGETLQQKLDRVGPLDTPEVLRIGQQIARGLAAAHEKGLIHRDIKPSNILLEKGVEERVKITDFGLARAVADASLTQSGVIAGTPMYMAPEQTIGDTIDHRADLFSLGSVLYTMCSGRPPFRATTSMATLKRVAEDQPRPIREIIPEVPQWLCDIVAKLHAKKPDERFQSAKEVADLLGQHQAHLKHPSLAPMPAPLSPLKKAEPVPGPVQQTSVTSPLAGDGPGVRGQRRRRLAMAAVVLLFLAGGLSITEATGVTNLRATVIRVFTPDGTLVVETDDPGVKVTVEGSGGLIITGAGLEEIRLRPGSYKVHADKDGKEILLDRDLVRIAKNGREVVRVKLEAPLPAKADLRAFKVGEVRKHHWPGRRAYFADFSPDGLYYVATGEANGPGPTTVRVWELASGKLVMEGIGNEFAIFTRDSKRLIAAGPDKQIHVWDLATRKEIAQFGEHPDGVRRSSLSADGKQLLTGCNDGIVRLWDVAEGKEITRLESNNKLTEAYFCPDGKQAITAENASGIIRLWDLAQGNEIRSWQQHGAISLGILAFLPGGQRFVTIGTDTVYFWNLADEKETQSTRLVGNMLGGGFSPDCSRFLYTVASDPVMRLVELPGGKELATFESDGCLCGVGFSPDGRFAVAASEVGTVYVWRLPDPPALLKK